MTKLRDGARHIVTFVAAFAGYMVTVAILTWVGLVGFDIFAWLVFATIAFHGLNQAELPTKITEFRDTKPLDLDEEFRLMMEKQNNNG